jgi:predicted amidohydrolase
MNDLKILLVSPNHDAKNDTENFWSKIFAGFELASEHKADLIVFPESTYYLIEDETELELELLIDLSTRIPIPFIIGVCVSRNYSEWFYYYNPNAAPHETKSKLYCKHCSAGELAFEIENYAQQQQAFFSPILLKGYKIQVNICQDIYFPLVTERMERNGMDLLINLTGSNVNLSKWQNVVRGRSLETGKIVLCTMGYLSERHGTAAIFGFQNGEKLKFLEEEAYVATDDDKYQFQFVNIHNLQIDEDFQSRRSVLESNKYNDFYIGFNAEKPIQGFDLFLREQKLFCRDGIRTICLSDSETWQSDSKTKSVKILSFAYQNLFDRTKLQKSALWTQEEAHYCVVYYSTETVNIDETLALMKLRAIENRITAICYAPNCKVVIKTNKYKNIQFFESEEGGIVGIDLRQMAGLPSVFGKKMGIPSHLFQKYLNLI